VKNGGCVLFLGSAIHAAPPEHLASRFPAEQRPPVGAELSLRLAARSGFAQRRLNEDPRNLQRVSLDYELGRGRTALVQAVRDEVQLGKVGSPLLCQLARLNFPLIVTTNYDTHLETALSAAGKAPFVSVYNNNLVSTELTDDYPYPYPTAEAPLVLKIHGDILRKPSSIVITDEDYIQFVIRMSDKEPYHPIPTTAKFFLAKFPTLFLGYSLVDYNLRMLFKMLCWRMPTPPQTYSVDCRPDSLIREMLQKTGLVQYIVEDVWSFVPGLVAEVLGHEVGL
jgi:hypothetical protein